MDSIEKLSIVSMACTMALDFPPPAFLPPAYTPKGTKRRETASWMHSSVRRWKLHRTAPVIKQHCPQHPTMKSTPEKLKFFTELPAPFKRQEKKHVEIPVFLACEIAHACKQTSCTFVLMKKASKTRLSRTTAYTLPV